TIYSTLYSRVLTFPLSPYTTLFRSKRIDTHVDAIETSVRILLRLAAENQRVGGHRDFVNYRERLELANQIDEMRSNRRLTDEERSEEHTSELQSRFDLVCLLLLEKK